MFSATTATLLAIPAVQVVGNVATRALQSGQEFYKSLTQDAEEPEQRNTTNIKEVETSSQVTRDSSTKPATLQDLLQTLQRLVASLSDSKDNTVTVSTLSDSEVQVTGDEPLATSVRQWTRLHPEWVRDWNAQSMQIQAGTDNKSENLSAKISATTAIATRQ